jgi:ribosomal protein L30E
MSYKVKFAEKKKELSPQAYSQWVREQRLQYERGISKRNIEFMDQYKSCHPCSCGESNVYCLEFHHLDPAKKSFRLGNYGRRGSISRIKEEIAKCIVLCKNCHTLIHSDNFISIPQLHNKIESLQIERDSTKELKIRESLRRKIQKYKNRLYMLEYKKDHKCNFCEEDKEKVLVFHHRDMSTKKDTFRNLKNYGLKTIQAEIDKCIVLCQNCHSNIHNKENRA